MLSALLEHTLFEHKQTQSSVPREGELYKKVTVAGKTFHLYYGYYEEFERAYNDPMPIYPDFLKEPLCTLDGLPFVTAMQDICKHYKGKTESDGCSQCAYFQRSEDLFGLCSCPQNKHAPPGMEVAQDE